MSSPVSNLGITITTVDDVVVGATYTTNNLGKVSIKLPPGEYKVILNPLFGYTFTSGVLVNYGETPLDLMTLGDIPYLTRVIITEGETSIITGGFTQNL